MDRAKELMEELEQIDAQILDNEAVLKANNIGMDEPLVDEQDFPRTGVDLYAVRGARGKIRCLQNDRKTKMAEMESILGEIHQLTGKQEREGKLDHEPLVHRTSNDPFVQVDKVMPESPAQNAGLRDGDLIVQFGTLHADVFHKLDQLKDVVTEATSANKPIRVTVLRKAGPIRVHHVELVPKAWSGNGLIGCSFTVVERNKKR